MLMIKHNFNIGITWLIFFSHYVFIYFHVLFREKFIIFIVIIIILSVLKLFSQKAKKCNFFYCSIHFMLYFNKTLLRKIHLENAFQYCCDLRSSCSWESMKNPLNDARFINRRNFRYKQALSAMVIYNDAVHSQRSTADSTGNQIQR